MFLVSWSSEGARVTLHFLRTSPETWTVYEFCQEVMGMLWSVSDRLAYYDF